jgi:peroxiredoxin
MSVAVGDRFPAKTVLSTEGELDLAKLWASGVLVIAFHRMWCPFCQQAAIQLSDAAPELERLGAVTVIVYREGLDAVAAACEERHTETVCVSDAHQSLETAVGVGRFKVMRYFAFSPRRILAARRAGAKVGGMGTNVLQGRGTYVVGGDGRVVYAHEARTAADIPPIEEIVSAVRASARPERRGV